MPLSTAATFHNAPICEIALEHAAPMTAVGTSRTSRDVRLESAKWGKADIGSPPAMPLAAIPGYRLGRIGRSRNWPVSVILHPLTPASTTILGITMDALRLCSAA
jgi:hypothetical protein